MLTEATVIKGVNNGIFYVRSVDANGKVRYHSQHGSEQSWIAYAIIRRPENWAVASHAEMIASQY